MMELQFLYVNCANEEEARHIGRRMVEDKWSASASIIPHTSSFYYWEGQLREDKQVSLFLQCRTDQMPEVCRVIKSMHSFSLPCIIGTPITSGDPAFIDWIQRVLPGKTTPAPGKNY